MQIKDLKIDEIVVIAGEKHQYKGIHKRRESYAIREKIIFKKESGSETAFPKTYMFNQLKKNEDGDWQI